MVFALSSKNQATQAVAVGAQMMARLDNQSFTPIFQILARSPPRTCFTSHSSMETTRRQPRRKQKWGKGGRAIQNIREAQNCWRGVKWSQDTQESDFKEHRTHVPFSVIHGQPFSWRTLQTGDEFSESGHFLGSWLPEFQTGFDSHKCYL